MAEPALPRPTKDPTGLNSVEDRAFREFNRRIKAAYNEIIQKVILELPYRVIELNESAQYFVKNERVYRYELDAGRLASLGDIIREIVDRWLLTDKDGNFVSPYNPSNLWFMSGYVNPAYQKGTMESYSNLSIQVEAYKLAIPEFTDILFSEPYMRRIGLLAARQFENMKGFGDSMVKVTQQILSDGVAAGIGVREMAKQLQERTTDVHHLDSARAMRIVATEVTYAFRKAKMDEQDSADEKYGIKSKLMHISAFSDTTRPWHASRHGKLFTTQEQRDWYLKPINSINCKCSSVTVVVDNNGIPLAPGLVRKAIEQRERILGS